MQCRQYLDLQCFPVDFWDCDIGHLPVLQGSIGWIRRLKAWTSVETHEHLGDLVIPQFAGIYLEEMQCPQRLSLYWTVGSGLRTACVRVRGELVQIVVPVEGVVFFQVDELLQGLIDEDDTDERGEGFLRESGDVAHERAGIGSHQQDAEESCPQTNACPQGQVGQAVFSEIRVLRKEQIKQHHIVIV